MKFKFTDNNKRYYTLNYYNKQKYGCKVQKAAVNAGLTCPNIDGNFGTGGCIYCDSGSAYFTDKCKNLEEQITAEINRINKNGKINKFIVYYQSNTNTYTDLNTLENMLKIPLLVPQVVGITLSTRTDCLNNEKLDLLCKYNEKTDICLEFGLQSIHNKTLDLINRCQTYESFLKDYEIFKLRNLRSCIHIINGLPFETEQMMLETAKRVGQLHPEGLKIHMLHIVKDTALAKMYEKTDFELLSKEKYIEIVSKQLEIIPPDIVIERITGDPDKQKLIAPIWTADKKSVLSGIDKYLAQNNMFQGKRCGLT